MFITGYVWYTYPVNSSSQLLTPREVDNQFALRYWEDAALLTNYDENGMIVVTERPEYVPPDGWLAEPVNVQDGWGYERKGCKVRHLHTEERKDGFYSIFAGLVLPQKV